MSIGKERVVYVRRSFTRGELKRPKTEASMRAVPLQGRALDALDLETGSATRIDTDCRVEKLDRMSR